MKHIIAAFLASTMFGSTAFATEPTNQTHIWPTGTVLMADGVFQAGIMEANVSGLLCFTAVNVPLGATLGNIIIPGNVTVRVGLYAPNNGSSGPGTLDLDLGVTSYWGTTGTSIANFPNGSYNAGSGGIHWIATLAPSSTTTLEYVDPANPYNQGGTTSMGGGAVGFSSFHSNNLPISVGSTLCTIYTYGALPVTPPANLFGLGAEGDGTLLVGLYH